MTGPGDIRQFDFSTPLSMKFTLFRACENIASGGAPASCTGAAASCRRNRGRQDGARPATWKVALRHSSEGGGRVGAKGQTAAPAVVARSNSPRDSRTQRLTRRREDAKKSNARPWNLRVFASSRELLLNGKCTRRLNWAFLHTLKQAPQNRSGGQSCLAARWIDIFSRR